MVPLVALSVAGDVWGRNLISQHIEGSDSSELPQELVAPYAVARAASGVAAILLFGLFIRLFSETFHGRHGYVQSFVLAAYSLGPLFLFHMLDVIPGIHPVVSFIVGILFSMYVLYYGIPIYLRPDPPHAFGLYLTSAIVMLLVTGLARFFTLYVLDKKVHLF